MDIPAGQFDIDLGKLPVVQHASVFHVGTLQADNRERLSYEGDGLSVSVHPQDWRIIARLTGSTWELRHPNLESMSFLNVHSLSCDQRDTVLGWGLSQGWVEKVLQWQIPDFDENDNIVGSFCFDSFEEAAGELEMDERDDCVPMAVENFVATADLPVERMEGNSALEGLLAVYVQHLTELDGLWWNDSYDPQRCSCPRGVLLRGVGELSCSSV